MNLKVESPGKYDGRIPLYNRPLEIGAFSVDSNRNFFDDRHQLKYLSMPSRLSGLHIDLNEGYSQVIRTDYGKILAEEKMDMLLKWIITHQEQVKTSFRDCSSSTLKLDFVCYRGLLTSINATIYESEEDWLICATKFKSVIYLCTVDTKQAKESRESMTEREKLMTSWGYKFEQCMTSDTKKSRPNTSVPVNEKEEFYSVMKGKLDSNSILLSAEVDGEDPAYYTPPGHNPSSMQRYIELKTSKIISSERQNQNFCRFKLLKWWLQSFLAGIPKVICGFRDNDGIVQNVDVFNVRDLPGISNNLWSPTACFNFCSNFLKYVKHCVVKDDPHVVYKFYWKPGSEITCEELQSPTQYQILPDWYIKDLKI